MRCVRCHRPIGKAAITAGAYAWGPKCARVAGLVRPEDKKRAAKVRIAGGADETQLRLDLDGSEAAA